jgi:hypothetical protein
MGRPRRGRGRSARSPWPSQFVIYWPSPLGHRGPTCRAFRASKETIDACTAPQCPRTRARGVCRFAQRRGLHRAADWSTH